MSYLRCYVCNCLVTSHRRKQPACGRIVANLRGYKGRPRRVVEASQLPVGAEVSAGGGLRFDDGGELVGGVIHASSVRKVDESAGGEAVPSGRRTPVETGDSTVTPPVRAAVFHSNSNREI